MHALSFFVRLKRVLFNLLRVLDHCARVVTDDGRVSVLQVRAVLKSRKKKKALQWQGFEMGGDEHSIDSYASNMLIEKVP